MLISSQPIRTCEAVSHIGEGLAVAAVRTRKRSGAGAREEESISVEAEVTEEEATDLVAGSTIGDVVGVAEVVTLSNAVE